jgi:hypothetical protein
MTEYRKFIEELREQARLDGDYNEDAVIKGLRKAADALEAQAREIAELKEVLKPFIAIEKPFLRQSYEDENDIVLWVNIRDFYAARAALKGEK